MFSPYIIFVQVMEEKHAEKAELEAAIAAIRFTFQTRRFYEARMRHRNVVFVVIAGRTPWPGSGVTSDRYT